LLRSAHPAGQGLVAEKIVDLKAHARSA